MEALIAFWTHALAAALFSSLTLWELRRGLGESEQRMLLAAFALTACWAWITAMAPTTMLAAYSETARNLVWVGVLYRLAGIDSSDEQRGVKPVYAAVAGVLGLQLLVDALPLVVEHRRNQRRPCAGPDRDHPAADRRGRRAGAGPQPLRPGRAVEPRQHPAGDDRACRHVGLRPQPLHHRLFRPRIGAGPVRLARAGAGRSPRRCSQSAATQDDRWRIRLSRAATFQSLSLLAISAYLAVMAVLVTALRGSGVDWTRAMLIALLAAMTVGGDRPASLQPGARLGQGQDRQASVRASLRLSHRMAALHRNHRRQRARRRRRSAQRVIKAFADILDAPGGLLLVADETWHRSSRRRRGTGRAAPTSAPRSQAPKRSAFWLSVGAEGRIIDFDALGGGWADARDRELDIPAAIAWRGAGLDRRSADPRRPAGRPRPARRARITAARSTGKISTCSAPRAGRPPRRWPKPMASRP